MDEKPLITLGELAEKLGARLVGDPSLKVSKVAPIEHAQKGDLTFLSDSKKYGYLKETKASAVIVSEGIEAEGKNLLVVKDPYVAFARVQSFFYPRPQSTGEISSLAWIHPEAVLGENVTILPFACVERGVNVGEGCIIHSHVFLGEGVKLGKECVLYSGVKVYHECLLGDRVTLHSGVVVGSDGFGYAWDGRDHLKIPQVGKVVIGDDVEVGANTTIDRGTLGDTVIGDGVKIDNLVQIGHNVKIGSRAIIVAQVGIAGSSEIGEGAILAGQVGVAGHIRIGKQVKIAAQSGIHNNIKDGEILCGTPAIPVKNFFKSATIFSKLPELRQRIRQLEKKLGEMEKKFHESISRGENL
ncbi:MAG: UDP-3-O-(3-hydroxymyristoyl)glucosamine N-acyltransferase [Deltaproteobacteria bacterium]|nr:UDP-3-O-(3-hydroxymyristoyl)glucosamine N-acyltransferase [Deltaproteobacteria bacterium]